MQAADPPHHFLLLNADTIVRPNAFKALTAFMDAHPEGSPAVALSNRMGSSSAQHFDSSLRRANSKATYAWGW
jgi:hypothetical protein